MSLFPRRRVELHAQNTWMDVYVHKYIYNRIHTYVLGGLVGGPRAYQDQFVGSSLTECMLAGTFSCIKKK